MTRLLCLLLTSATLFVSGCTQNAYTGNKQISKTAIGASIGAAGGAIAGLLTGDNSKQRRKHALIGAGIGALAGGGVGFYMDQQEAKLRQRLRNSGVSITRNGNEITLNMPGNITFDSNDTAIKPHFYEVLNSVSLVLKEFNKTYVDIDGHTDSSGSEQYNLSLSETRARSVGEYLIGQGVMRERVISRGFGESRPIGSNDIESGKAANRRVEIRLSPVT